MSRWATEVRGETLDTIWREAAEHLAQFLAGNVISGELLDRLVFHLALEKILVSGAGKGFRFIYSGTVTLDFDAAEFRIS